ncbi:MAG TPA: PKD domain-containing protein [Chryseolinea sp.]|nr:PKD domain-containing protein [Chryseolinea sp.]
MYRNYLTLFLVCCLGWFVESAHGRPDPGIKYIENKNQWPDEVDFSARVPGGRMFIQPGRFVYNFIDEGRLEELHLGTHSRSDGEASSHNREKINGRTVVVQFNGANSAATPMRFGQSVEYYNYFLGNDSCKWASRAYAYNGFIYQSFYEGIDLKVYSEGSNVKYDFIVAPGANPGLIDFAYDGIESLSIDNAGDLTADASLTMMREKKPVAFQYIDGSKVVIACTYVIKNGHVQFSFPEGYDPCYELVIDPLLIFSTYSGSTADNWGSTATPGEHGRLYSAGVTNEAMLGGQFPATPGVFQPYYGGIYDVGILKYDSSGQHLLYATYLGGTESESPESLVMNSSEELLVLGATSSSDFPTTVSAFDRVYNGGVEADDEYIVIPFRQGSDIFISKINREGDRLLSSTYLGGNQNDGMIPHWGVLDKNYGDMLRGDIITDDDNNVYISSVTGSSNFPAINGIDLTFNGGPIDAVAAKFNPTLSTLVWSTYLGGSGSDAALSIKIDQSKNIYLAGGTTSSNFPTTSGTYQPAIAGGADGWIAKMSNSGDNLYNVTFTGTESFDQVYFVDLNESGEVYVYGQTSGDFPVTPGVYSNPNSGQFIQKFSSSLNTLIFSTVIGSGSGIPDISPTAFLVNECNNLYLSGWGGGVNIGTLHWQSNTIGMPITDDAFQKTTSGSDFYFMVLTDDGSQFLYGTYLGGTQSNTHVDGGTSRFDKSGIVYHAVCSGCRTSPFSPSYSDFPTTAGAWSASNNSDNCNNAAFKFDLSSLKARLQSNSTRFDLPGLSKVCMPDKIVFQNLSTGGETYEWDMGDGTKLTKVDTAFIVHQYLATGRYTVSLKAIDKGTCKVKDSVSIKVDVFLAESEVQDDDDMCEDAPYTLHASGGAWYSWISEDSTFTSTFANPIVNPEDTTRYFVTVIERSGCLQKDTVQLNVIPIIRPEFEVDRTAECINRPQVGVLNSTDSLRENDRLFFDFGDGASSDNTEVYHTYENDGLYNVKLVGVREFCVSETVVSVPIFTLLIPNIITPGNDDSTNDKFTIQYGNTPGTTPADYGFKTSVIIYNRWGEEVFHSDDYQYDWRGEGLAAGTYFYEVTVDQHSTCKSWLQLVK